MKAIQEQITTELCERLLDQVFDARTLTEIKAAREALHGWMTAHPDEPGMADALEVLSHREDFANEGEALPNGKQPATVR
jgi:hypothetical protein